MRFATTLLALSNTEETVDLEEIRCFFGLKRFCLLGVDYFGALAMHYAKTHPGFVERVVVINPLPPRREPFYDDIQIPSSFLRVPYEVA